MMAYLGLFWILGGVVLLLLALWLYMDSNRAKFREKVGRHFSLLLPVGTVVPGLVASAQQTRWQLFMMRASLYAGFEIKNWHFLIIPLVFLAFAALGWYWFGLIGAVIMFAASILILGYLVPSIRLKRYQSQVISQIPMFIDQVLRSLGSGRSIEGAVRLAAVESPAPLQQILARVVRGTDLGADMPESIAEAARLHGLRELDLVALAMRISHSYGSSPKEMLQSVVLMIRQQELARRELAAMTGETRISALVLALLPVSLAMYMMLANPGYMGLMMAVSSGNTMLIVAACLQVTGIMVLWRMLKSV